MASSAKQISLLLLLLTLLSSSLHTHARDSQFFNKIPSTTNAAVVVPNNNAVVPDNNGKEQQQQQQQQQQEPNFVPENENGYGLYGHESGQEPPSTAATTATTPYSTEFKQPAHKYLPKNYNPVAYVTQPEDNNVDGTAFTEERSFSNNPTNYYSGEKNYYNNQQQEEQTHFRNYPAAATKDNGNYYYNGASSSSFNTRPTDNRYRASATFSNGGATSFQPQGMSDTRFMENGKYFYDINAEKYSSNHPYESLRGARNEFNNRNLYGNSENYNGYEFNSENAMGGYQNQEEFQEEESLP